jgi:hypothetical protein
VKKDRGQNTQLGRERPQVLVGFAAQNIPLGSLPPNGTKSVSRCFVRAKEKFRNHRKETIVSFIKKPPETVSREFQLEEPLAQTLDSYAKFISSTPDHVVASALRFVFWKDKEFDRLQKEQKKAHKTAQPAEVKKP